MFLLNSSLLLAFHISLFLFTICLGHFIIIIYGMFFLSFPGLGFIKLLECVDIQLTSNLECSLPAFLHIDIFSSSFFLVRISIIIRIGYWHLLAFLCFCDFTVHLFIASLFCIQVHYSLLLCLICLHLLPGIIHIRYCIFIFSFISSMCVHLSCLFLNIWKL